MKKLFSLCTAAILILTSISSQARMIGVTPTIGIPLGPDLPIAPYDIDFMAGRAVTFNVKSGGGDLNKSGVYVLKITTNDLITVSGKVQVKAVDTSWYDFNLYYTNTTDPRVGDYYFNMLAPLSGTFSNVLFKTSNAPPVETGRQAGTFYMTDKKLDLNQDGEADVIWENADGHLGVWFMTNSVLGTVADTNLLKGFYLDSLYIATSNTIQVETYFTNVYLNDDGFPVKEIFSFEETVPNYDRNWRVIAQKDLDLNGMIDLVWQNTNSGAMRTWLLNNTNFIHPSITNYHYDLYNLTNIVTNTVEDVEYYTTNIHNAFVRESSLAAHQPPDGSTRLLSMSDFDNDGYPDYLFKQQDGSIFYESYWETFDSAVNNTNRIIVSAPVNTNLCVAAIMDLDNDGWPDILWQNKVGSAVVWYMKGDPATKAYKRVKTGVVNSGAPMGNWKIVGNADFNFDGQTDIMVRNLKTGQIIYWYMKGAAKGKISTIGGPVVTWDVVGPK